MDAAFFVLFFLRALGFPELRGFTGAELFFGGVGVNLGAEGRAEVASSVGVEPRSGGADGRCGGADGRLLMGLGGRGVAGIINFLIVA